MWHWTSRCLVLQKVIKNNYISQIVKREMLFRRFHFSRLSILCWQALKQGQPTWPSYYAYALCMSISNECECGKKSFNHSPSGLKLSEAFATIESNSSVRNFGIAVGTIFRSISSVLFGLNATVLKAKVPTRLRRCCS